MSVNALNGLFPFLHFIKSWSSLHWVCQRPKRALSISTEGEYYVRKINSSMCQRPKRALSISTENNKNISAYCFSVNALNGLFPFLQLRFQNKIKSQECVSTP